MHTLSDRRLTIKLNIKKKKHKKKNEQKPFFPSLNHKNQDVNVGPVLLGEENYLFHPVNIYSFGEKWNHFGGYVPISRLL